MEEQWTKTPESPYPEPPELQEPPRDGVTVPAETEPERPPVDLRQARHAFRRIELFAFLLMLIFQVVGVAAMVIMLLTKPALTLSEWFLCLASWAPLYLVALPACYPLVRRLPRSAPVTEKLGGGRLFSIFLICIFLTYACNLLSILILSILEAITGLTAVNPVESLGGVWSTLLFMVILAPLGEEWICRRLILDRLRRYGEKTAILVSALIFALLHGNLSQALYAFALGCVFGYVYLRTGRLRYCVGLHMAVNTVGGLLPTLIVTPLMDRIAAWDLEAELTMEQLTPVLGASLGLILYAALLLAAIVAGLVLLIKRRKRICLLPAEEELPAGQRFRVAFLNPGMILAVLLFLAMTAMTFLQ